MSKDKLPPLQEAVAGLLVAKAVGVFEASVYFVTRPGLCVSSEFTLCILPAYVGVIPIRGVKGVDHIDLPPHMYDREIVAECLGGMKEARNHAFTPDQLADLIDAQEGGTSGVLLNNGYVNALYMIGVDEVLFPVSVYWGSVDSHWRVFAGQFDCGCWPAVVRVFRNKR